MSVAQNPSTAPSTPKRKALTCDERVQAHALRKAGHKLEEIAGILNKSEYAVRYALKQEQFTPQFRKRGRKPHLSPEQEAQLIDFMTSSPDARGMTYKELSQYFSDWVVGPKCIKNALYRHGFRRYRKENEVSA